MAVDLSNVDSQDVDQIEEELVDALKAEYPSLDLSEGRVFRELVIRPAALFHAERQQSIDDLRQSMSLLAIEQNPDLADDDIVDGVLSNYRVARSQGTKATGSLTIVLSTNVTTTIPQGTIFTASGQTFTTDQSYVGVTTQDAVTSDQARLITQRTDGSYAFTIPVEAVEAGSAGDIRRNTRFTATPTIPGVIDIFATEDFAGGSDTQTNEELINEFKLGISPSVFSGRTQIEKIFLDNITGLQDTSITGFGDAEMIRDKHNLFGVSNGGKADIYLRTALQPVSSTLTKEATLIDKENGTWQLTIERDDAPGFYLVESVLPQNSSSEGTLEITGETRGLDLSQESNEFVPDVDNNTEGAYSRYQTAVVQFTDPDTGDTAVEGDKQNYSVNVLAMPNIKEAQDLAVARDRRNPQADYLVRAPVPGFCSVGLAVQYRGTSAPDEDAIKQSIVDRVNGLSFDTGQLPASIIHDAVHNAAGDNVIVTSPLDLFCQIRKPDGTFINIRDANGILIPSLPDECVSNRTVALYIDTGSIAIEVAQEAVLPV
jgi:hypothetical protein